MPGDIKDCCKDPQNLYIWEMRPDLIVRKCSVCDCRHFRLSVDPGVLGMRGTQLGT